MADINDKKGIALGENARIDVFDPSTGDYAHLCVRSGTVTEDPPEIPTTCTEGEGFADRTRGPRTITIDVEAQWRHQDNPVAMPPKLRPGNTYATGDSRGYVKVWPDLDAEAGNGQPLTGAQVFWELLRIYVVSCVVRIDAEGVQTYTLQIKNRGKYYSPQFRLEQHELTT